MSWNNNNQPNLPYNATGPERQPLNLSLGNPPYVPASFNGPQPLQQILPLICASAAIEIQQRAQNNPLRTFMFNQYSRNNFNNEDFAALIEATIEYIILEMNNNRYSDVERAAQNCVPQMCEMLCAINLRVFPDLEAYINQNVVQTLRNTISNFDNIANRIKQARSGNSGWNNGNNNNNNQGNNGWNGGNNNGNTWNNGNGGGGNNWNSNSGNNNSGGSQNRWSNTGSWSSGTAKPSTGNTGALFNSQSSSGNAEVSGNFRSKYDDKQPLKQPYEARKENPVSQQQQQEEMHVLEAPLNSGEIKWVPSNRYPYVPAIAPTVGEIWLRKHPASRDNPNGLIEPFLKEKDTSVDYDKHDTGSIFGPPPRTLDMSNAAKTMAKIEEGVRKVNNTVTMSDDEKKAPEVTTLVNQKVMIETSLESAWVSGSLNRLTAPAGQLPDVYRTYARIALPLVTQEDLTDVITNFGQSKTYIELREKLQAAIEEKKAPQLWGTVNTRLTDMINRILSQKLALPGENGTAVSIDSFLGDIEDLISFLGKSYGQNVQQAFLKHQKQEIQSMFITLDEKLTKDLSDGYVADMKFDDANKPTFTFLASDYSLTFLDCLSYELDVDMVKGIGTLMTDAGTPIVHNMLSGLFADIEERGGSFERHLFITNDGRTLEAVRGYLGEKAYMLTLVK